MVAGAKSLACEYRHYLTEQHAGIGTLPTRVGVGEMLAYVAEGGCSEKCVTEGVKGYIGVAVAEESAVERYVDTAYYAAAPFGQAVHVETVAGTDVREEFH